MIILHVITTLDRGGAENHLFELATRQSFLGHNVHIAYLQGSGELVDRLSTCGVRCFSLRGSSTSFFKFIRCILSLRQYILSISPDVVHAHMPPAELSSWLGLLFIRPRIRFVISKHVDSSFFSGSLRRNESLAGAWLASIVMLRASRIVAISKSVSRYLYSNYFFLPSSKVTVVYYGIDPQRFSGTVPLPVHSSDSSHLITIGTAARLVYQKNIDTLLLAFAHLHRSPRSNLRLFVAGDGPLIAPLKNLSIQLGIHQSVHWFGKIANIESFMKRLDIFVLPSRYEGLGLVLLEAMASALPVVASNVSAIPEIVLDGQTGLLCPVDQVESFSEAIDFLAARPSIRRSMGLKGLERVHRYFAVNSMAEKTLEVYS